MSLPLVTGVFIGALYGLFAVGLVVTYRGSRVLNFAHGEIGMIGAFAFAEVRANGMPTALAILLGVLISGLAGTATELFLVRPLRQAPRITVMMGTFGVAGFLLVVASRRWGLDPRNVAPLVRGSTLRVLGAPVSPGQIVMLVASVALVLAVSSLYGRTKLGLQMRVTAIDPYAAAEIGINTELTSVLSWAIAGMIAGLSAILIAPLVAFNIAFMTSLLIRGITAALVGGLTSLWGAFATGMVIGVAEQVLNFNFNVSGLVEVVLALAVISLLLVRPSGLVPAKY